MSHSVKCLGYMLEGVKMINDDKCIMMIVADVKIISVKQKRLSIPRKPQHPTATIYRKRTCVKINPNRTAVTYSCHMVQIEHPALEGMLICC